MPRPRISTWWRISAGDVPSSSSALAAQLDHVVGDQPVAAPDQLEGGLALADAARTANQHADAQHLHQGAVEAQAPGLAGRPLAAGRQNLASSSSIARSTSSRVSASISALRKPASRKKREMRASAFRCMPPECSGTTSRKNR